VHEHCMVTGPHFQPQSYTRRRWASAGAQVHFCYLCRNLLRGAKAGDGARHFGPKGCKQHTAG